MAHTFKDNMKELWEKFDLEYVGTEESERIVLGDGLGDMERFAYDGTVFRCKGCGKRAQSSETYCETLDRFVPDRVKCRVGCGRTWRREFEVVECEGCHGEGNNTGRSETGLPH